MDILKIYTLQDDGTSVLFPNEYEPAVMENYEYSVSRMGSAPSITAKIKHRMCLDNLWTEKQYVEFGSEKFFVRDTPSSTKTNDDTRYEHDITFLHERFVLENVYMFDAVFKDAEHPEAQPVTDKYVSNSTKVVFWGDVKEFVDRFNACLQYAGLGGVSSSDGYFVVVDEDLSTEEKLVAFEDKFFSEALQEIYDVFGLPYYWVGKVCHIGYSADVVSKVFEYGSENELLKIEKQNTNEGYCNRATGVGSSDNLPVYYPNTVAANYTFPHAISADDGTTANKGITNDSLIEVVSDNKFATIKQASAQEKPFDNYGIAYYDKDVTTARIIGSKVYSRAWNVYTAANQAGKNTWRLPCEISAYGSVQGVDLLWKTDEWSKNGSRSFVFANGEPITEETAENFAKTFVNIYKPVGGRMGSAQSFWVEHMPNIICSYLGNTPPSVERTYIFNTPSDSTQDYCFVDVTIGYWISGALQNFKKIDAWLTADRAGDMFDSSVRFTRTTYTRVDENGITVRFLVSGLSASQGGYMQVKADIEKYNVWNPEPSWLPVDASVARRVYTDEVLGGDTFHTRLTTSGQNDIMLYSVISKDGGQQFFNEQSVVSGKFLYDFIHSYKRCEINTPLPVVSRTPASWYDVNVGYNPWYEYQLSDFGLALKADPATGVPQTPVDGDRIVRIYKEDFSRMPVHSQLMPSIYFETSGEYSFYNALNEGSLLSDELYSRYKDFYKNEDGNYYDFEHEFVSDNPREGKFDFPEIKPTIKGLTNIDGKSLDKFVDVGFDDNDHDYLKGDKYGGDNDQYVSELSSDSKYEHSYFFVRLPRTVVKDKEGYDFNLFDKAALNDMSISVTSGSCGACKFRIMVEDGDLKRNPVVVWREGEKDERGNVHHAGELRKDKYGRVVLVGTSNGAGFDYQAEQQDTTQSEVWVCLEKETDTYGIIMPNCAAALRPKAGDTFVILDIYLPVAYILAAQDLLSEKIISAMHENNRERFGFSVDFSRIYLAENRDVLSQLNENSKIKVKYNGFVYELYVSSYSYKVSQGAVLPEVSVELSTKITQGTPLTRQNTSEISGGITTTAVGAGVEIIGKNDTTEPTDDNVYSAQASDNKYLSKNGGTVNGDIDVNGTMKSQNTETEVLTVGDFTFGGTGAVNGAKILPDGTIVARQLRLEDRLIVPSVEYNKATVLFGILVISPACGKIKTVTPDPLLDKKGNNIYHKKDSEGNLLYQSVNENGEPIYNGDGTPRESIVFSDYPIQTLENTGVMLYGNTGTAELDLTEGEFGSLVEDDMLLGFWHSLTNNSSETYDGHVEEGVNYRIHDGDFGIAGFSSVYFSVDKVDYEAKFNGAVFKYSLRKASDNSWTNPQHPAVGMDFYGFGNFSDETRQSITIITRDYTVRLINKRWWKYDYNNVVEIHGLLDGFSMLARNRAGETYVKKFYGYGNVMGNAYVFGEIDKFERVAYKMEFDTDGDTLIGAGETKTITCYILDGYGIDVTEDVIAWSVERISNDDVADTQWNVYHKDFQGVLEITIADIGFTDRVRFKFVATMPDNEETTAYINI